MLPPPKEEFDFIDADTLTQVDPLMNDPETRRGYFSARKKKTRNTAALHTAALSPSNKKNGGKLSDARKEDEEGTPAEGF